MKRNLNKINITTTLLVVLTSILSSEVVAKHTTGQPDKLSWTGCGISRKAFMAAAAKQYEKKYGTKIKLTGGGATKGIRSAVAGHTSMGGSCRHTLGTLYKQQESNAVMTVVAWDAIVPIVNRSNPVESVTLQEIKGILTGRITNWKKIKGGLDHKIELLVRVGKISGVGLSVRELLFGTSEESLLAGKDIPFGKEATTLRSSKPLEKSVEKNNFVFAVTGVSSAKKRNVKILKINGVSAGLKNIAEGKFSTYRPLYIITKGPPRGETGKFISWLLSPEGQDLIEREGTVSLRMGVEADPQKTLGKKFKFWPKSRKNILNLEDT